MRCSHCKREMIQDGIAFTKHVVIPRLNINALIEGVLCEDCGRKYEAAYAVLKEDADEKNKAA